MIKKILKKYLPKEKWNSLISIKKKTSRKYNALIFKANESSSLFIRKVVARNVRPIVWLDTLSTIETLKQSSSTDAYEPCYTVENKFSVEMPDVNLYKLKTGYVHAKSSHIVLKDAVVLERLPHIHVDQCNYSTGHISCHNSFFSIIKTGFKVVEIERALFIGGNGSWNYYHWTIEIVTKLKYFLESALNKEKITIILPEYAKKIESFSMMVSVILKERYEIIYLNENRLALVNELYTITSPSNVVFNVAHGADFKKNFFFIDRESVDFLRESILNSAEYLSFLDSEADKIKYKKVFLCRKEGSVRKYNQNEVLEILVKKDFFPVFLEDLSFFQQVYLFQNVDYLVGASGAGWTNLIYVNKGTIGLSWLSDNASDFSCYSTIAKYYGCDLKFFKCESSNNEDIQADYTVDINKILNLI
ncbi:glycosyltransferase family 61 protein [Marinomonas sp. M1K-6]|uniref:Glycosyltransferase family 61 protein n=1 Tax=Marinomonas profundi TaxID=2726122 RepID=A0A847R4Q0_9GAMM|nr:glycosyltransferase family 61 protein [Marinomonas profundi]NLQ18975.1 glycosyltransferase family 61 protein [Marinomonas profundi]UDV04193.1 glycosyltransferase family 61 protein [Marinomonas profundi]